MIYCEGKNCSRRDKCAYHEVFDWEYNRQYLDKSTNGYGHEGVDEKGNRFSHHAFYCGDNATHYKSYKALGFREDQEYRNSIKRCYDEECVNCIYRSLCFTLAEHAGLITHTAKRIMDHICEDVKKDPQYFINKIRTEMGQ